MSSMSSMSSLSSIKLNLNAILQKNNYNPKTSNSTSSNKNEELMIIFKANSIISNQIEINMSNFIDKINLIPASKNVVDISKSIELTNIDLISSAAMESTIYKTALKGENKEFAYKFMIKKINCDINPIMDNKLKQSIAIIKWQIYNFMIQRKEKQLNTPTYIEFDISISKWVGLLAGICLYFDEIDEVNYKQTTFLNDVCVPLNINSFKPLKM